MTPRLWLVFGVLLLVLLGFAAYILMRPNISFGPFLFSPEESETREFELKELGVELSVPQTLSDLAYEAHTIPRIGTILLMQANSIPDPVTEKGCELGVAYLVRKDALAESGWTEERLRAAVEGEEGVAPQAKELSDAYFVFEPSQAVCTNDESLIAREAEKRAALWGAVPSIKES